MITDLQEALLIDLLSKHDTPTEAVRKALKAEKCEIRLTTGDVTIVICDITCREHQGRSEQ